MRQRAVKKQEPNKKEAQQSPGKDQHFWPSTIQLFSKPLSLKNGKKLDPQITIDCDNGKLKIGESDQSDLSDTFLMALDEPRKSDWSRRKRRWFFLLGGLFGIFLGWLFTDTESLPSLDMDSWDLQHFNLPFNMTEMLQPGRDWLNQKDTAFTVGRDVAARGQYKEHSVILVPGIVSSALELWSTNPTAAPFFRKRIWASTSMIRLILTAKDEWVAAMTLDETTGLDREGYKVRAAQGLDAASAFIPGVYWIWQKVIENLAVLDYDHNDLQLFSYDWRLSFYNLEVRDRYFSRLKYQIEMNLAVTGKKTVLVSHSMGAAVVLWFMKWVEAPEHGNGGSDWCEKHINDWVNIAGTLLGVPKAMAAILSGEMRDTVEINPAAVYILEKYFSRSERARLIRSWAGSASMIMKGGNDVWGDSSGAPDDKNDSIMSFGSIYRFKPEEKENVTEVTSSTVTPNLTLTEGMTYVLQHVPEEYQRMLYSNFSYGFERDPKVLKANNNDHTKWANPLEIELPRAPSMSIYCIYGTGKETERSYFYQQGGFETGSWEDPPNIGDCTAENPCEEPQSKASNINDIPNVQRRAWIDSTITYPESKNPSIRSGVLFGEGDGTVSLLSLGAMCVDGWKRKAYNPGGVKVVTHEINHEPLAFDVRGGPTTADHVDILGSSELNEAILDIASGHGDRVGERIISSIKEYSSKIKW